MPDAILGIQAAPARPPGLARRFARNRMAVVGFLVIAALILGSACADWLTLDPEEIDVAHRYAASFAAGHLLGADDLGRELASAASAG